MLFVLNDVDKNIIFKGKRYSQLIDTINDKINKFKTLSIIIPFTKYLTSDNYSKSLNIDHIWVGSIYFHSVLDRLRNCRRDIYYKRIQAWIDIIQHLQPKIIIAIQPPPELCIAAKQNNIYTFDLQHGVISTDGAGYYCSSYRAEYDQIGWPDVILCWDEHSKNWINDRYQQFVTARVIGNPFILRFYKNDSNDELVEEANQKMNKYLDCETINKKILVTAQWGHEDLEGIFKLGIPKSVVELIKRGDNEFEWWIRFHPVTLNNLGETNVLSICSDEFSGLTNVHFKAPTSLPLPLLLNKADLHITYSSATVKEASLFSVKSAILFDDQEKLKEWFSSEIEKGDAVIVNNTAESLEQWINSHSGQPDKVYSELKELSEKYEQFIDDLVCFLDTNNSDLLFNKHINN